VRRQRTAEPAWVSESRLKLVRESIKPILLRDLQQRGLAYEGHGLSSGLIGWLEIV
jgi:hypothetical protein